jgi:hypothetical protein
MPLLYMPNYFTPGVSKFTRFFLLLLFTITSGLTAKSQTPDCYFAPADSAFVLEISRVKTEVVLSITFKDSLLFDFVSIERQPDFAQSFTQCKYITYEEAKNSGRHVVMRDLYPVAASTNVMYRVKLGAKDGAMRTYPPVELKAVSK